MFIYVFRKQLSSSKHRENLQDYLLGTLVSPSDSHF
jgi:hypothetical protein